MILDFINLGGRGVNDTLRELYYGRIRPAAMKLPQDEEMTALIKRTTELEKIVTESLDEAGRENFTEFLKADGDFSDLQLFHSFCRGFRVGVRLMLEAIMDEPVKQ